MAPSISMTQPSFINNIPAEIWTEVFTLNSGQRSLATRNMYCEGDSMRWNTIVASQICSRLRQITIETPSLWTSIFVDFNASAPSSNLLLTKLWLERSENLPLSVTLSRIPRLDKEVGDSRECLLAILSQVPRWKDAFLAWTPSGPKYWSSMNAIIDHAPLLESLVIEYTENVGELMYQHELSLPSQLWIKSPLLRNLVVVPLVVFENDRYYTVRQDRLYPWVTQNISPYPHFVDFPSNYNCWTNSYNIPYRQLTHLRLDALCFEIIRHAELISIFSSSPRLISCFIEGISLAYPQNNSPTPVLLKYLRHLYVGCCSLKYSHTILSISHVLDYLLAPSLVTLTFSSDIGWEFQPYESFIIRSSCLLEDLNFFNTSVHPAKIIPIMRLLPSLQTIHLHGILMDPTIVDGLGQWDVVSKRYRICPDFQKLSLSGGPLLLHDWQERFVQALSTRLISPAGDSRRLTLLIPSVLDEHVPKKIRALSDGNSGLVIGFNDDMFKKGGLWDMYAHR